MSLLQSPATPIGFLAITSGELRQLLTAVVRDEIEEAFARAGRAPLPLHEELLSREETARALHVDMRTLRLYEKAGKLYPKRIGRRVLYRREDVLGYLDANMSLSTQKKEPRC